MLLDEILQSADVTVRPSRNDANEVTLCCPFCSERGESPDTRFRLGINVSQGLGHCYNCGWKGRGILDIARQLCHAFGLVLKRKSLVEAAAIEPAKKVAHKPVDSDSLFPVEYETFGAKPDEIESAAMSYLKSRGVSVLQIARHRIGYAAAGPMAWRVLFPVIDGEGNFHGCVGRAIVDGMRPKYLNTPGIKLLWNAQKSYGTAVVVEGVMDAIRTETALLARRGFTAVATLGSAATSVQVAQLRQFEKVILLPDWDEAGVHGVSALASLCRGMDVSVAIPLVLNDADPGSMTSIQILDSIDRARPWCSGTEARLRTVKRERYT
jgi:DNA primase